MESCSARHKGANEGSTAPAQERWHFLNAKGCGQICLQRSYRGFCAPYAQQRAPRAELESWGSGGGQRREQQPSPSGDWRTSRPWQILTCSARGFSSINSSRLQNMLSPWQSALPLAGLQYAQKKENYIHNFFLASSHNTGSV